MSTDDKETKDSCLAEKSEDKSNNAGNEGGVSANNTTAVTGEGDATSPGTEASSDVKTEPTEGGFLAPIMNILKSVTESEPEATSTAASNLGESTEPNNTNNDDATAIATSIAVPRAEDDTAIANSPAVTQPMEGSPQLDQDDEGLTEALPLKPDEEQGARRRQDLAEAEHYDPNQPRTPIYKRRAFVIVMALLYFGAIGGAIGASMAASKNRGGDESIMSPTLAPTLESFVDTRGAVEAVVATDSIESSPDAYESALYWMSANDPVSRSLDDPLLIQRFVLVWFWYHTTLNGAAPWLSCNPPDTTLGEDETCTFLDYDTLDQMYTSVNDTARWLTEPHECEWPGVECLDDDGDNNNQTVTGVTLRGMLLSGSFPVFLQELPHLQKIRFERNPQLAGTLPRNFTRLARLQELSLFGNALSGHIPESIFRIPHLNHFNVGFNAFSGSIPSSIGSATNLGWLQMSRNKLVGTMPQELSRLTKLETLILYDNLFSGPLPSSMPWPNMVSLELDQNLLNSTIPNDIYGMTNLLALYLSANDLSGRLDSSIGNLSRLTAVDLRDNRLTGPVPIEIANLLSARWIYLNYNLFEGGVPSEICALTSPEGLSVLWADCAERSDGSEVELFQPGEEWEPFQCLCCTACCNPIERTCAETDVCKAAAWCRGSMPE